MFAIKIKLAIGKDLGSARGSRAGFGGSPKQSCPKSAIVGRDRQHLRRVRYLEHAALALMSLIASSVCYAQDALNSPSANEAETAPVIVSAARIDIPLDQSPASTSVIDSSDFDHKQIERVSDALRGLPGLSVVQSGAQGQLTSVFTRGLRSEHTQVLLDGVPINQGLQGAMNFADFTTDDIDHIEVVRGPQSTLYGPRALAGVIQMFTRQGDGPPGTTVSVEGGTYATYREALESDGKNGNFDYSFGLSRIDTDNSRPNNDYRSTSTIGNLGWQPNDQLRVAALLMYSDSSIGLPNTIFDFRPTDHFETERWLVAPHLDLQAFDWWEHKLVFSYDHERQINNPNNDGFLGPTRAVFERTQLDYQNDLRPTSWLTFTSGFFYTATNAGEERPLVSFGPTFISDHPKQIAGFLQATVDIDNFVFVAGGRYTSFNQYGDIWTYRFAGSYKIDQTDTTVHASVATGFSPPSSQDILFRFNTDPLRPEEGLGWDAGVEQRLWGRRITVGATYFHNDLTNLIGFNGLFETLNLGSARTQGIETELRATPIQNFLLTASYTYLDAVNTSSADITQLPGARLPRRPRNEVYVSASYLWWKKLRTTVEAKWVNAREELNFGGPNFDIEDYNFVNIAAEYEVNRWLSIYGRIDNLTNEHYSEVFGFPALGQAEYIGVKVRF